MAKKAVLKKALADNDVLAKFQASSWGKKLQSKVDKANQSDFDRFKAMMAKKTRNAKVAAALKKMQK
jgi:large subunit ribosomal protein L14e